MRGPNKLFAFKFLALVAASALAPFGAFASSANSLIIGSWDCKTKQDGVTVESTYVYSRNNSFYGNGILELKVPSLDYDVVYSMSGTGKWRLLPGNVLETSGTLGMKNISSIPESNAEQEEQIRLELDRIINIEALTRAASQGTYEQIKFTNNNRFLSVTEGSRDWSKAETCIRN